MIQLQTQAHKLCPKCKVSKSISEFSKGQSWCKKCTSEAAKQWQKKNPEKYKAHVRRWQKKNPEKQKAYVRRWQKSNKERVLKYAGF